tara:strand:+ start:1789 stop:1962 length:174 start_codon:yes stop_codon:yes gene_type:complete
MNLKERGITVGDLVVILIIILTSAIVLKSLNKNKEKAFNLGIQDEISFRKSDYQKII